MSVPLGWKCPACLYVFAPHITSCDCCAKPPGERALNYPLVINAEIVEERPRCRVCFTHGTVGVHGLWEKCPWERRMEDGPDRDDPEPKEL